MLTFLTFFLVLSILVLVHELGHFLMAKRAGIWVEEFGFGLPPRVFGIKWGETIYSINLLPFGGFVRLYGEEGTSLQEGGVTEVSDWTKKENKFKSISSDRAFYGKPWWVKVGVVVAGVVMNLILAVVVFSVSYSVTGIPEETDQVWVIEIAPGSPAEEAGLKPGDRIVGLWVYGEKGQEILDSVKVHSLDDFSKFVDKYKGRPVMMNIENVQNWARERGLKTMEMGQMQITPRVNPPPGQGPTGVAISTVQEVFYPWWQMPFRGTVAGVEEAWGWSRLILTMLGQLAWQLVSKGTAPEGVAGPVGIYQITGQVVQFGMLAVMRFLGILSVNLAVLNILPLPALDGGRLAIILWEAATGKRIKAGVEKWIHSVGMAALLFLLVLVTLNDLVRLFGQAWWFVKLKDLLPK